MNYKEKAKLAATKKRQRKLSGELRLIAMGAGCWWLDDEYFEYQDDCEKCIGKFMSAVCEEYGLERDSYVFAFYQFEHWSSPVKLARFLDGYIQDQKLLARQEAAEREAS